MSMQQADACMHGQSPISHTYYYTGNNRARILDMGAHKFAADDRRGGAAPGEWSVEEGHRGIVHQPSLLRFRLAESPARPRETWETDRTRTIYTESMSQISKVHIYE